MPLCFSKSDKLLVTPVKTGVQFYVLDSAKASLRVLPPAQKLYRGRHAGMTTVDVINDRIENIVHFY